MTPKMNPKIETETTPLNPGLVHVDLHGRTHQIKDAAVRLITEGERRIVDMLEKKPDRDRAFLIKSLVRLGSVPASEISDDLIDKLLPIDVRRIERTIARLESRFKDTAPSASITGASTLSDPIKLHPGVPVDGQLAQTAVVRLLTRGDIKAILLEPEQNRSDAELARSITRLGDVDDPELIAEAVQNLTPVDEIRIRRGVVDLEKKFLTEEEPSPKEAPDSVHFEIRATEVLSQPFDLSPGITVDGEPVTTCVVRLATRGQWKQIQSAPESERDDLTLVASIASLGNITDQSVIKDCIREMTLPDIKRINKEVAALQDSFPE